MQQKTLEMSPKNQNISANNNSPILDYAAGGLALVGLIVPFVMEKALMVAAPCLSLSIGLSILSKKQLQTTEVKANQIAITQLTDKVIKTESSVNNAVEQSKENKINISKLNQQSRQQTEDLEALQQRLDEQTKENQSNFADLNSKIGEIQSITVNQLTEKINEYTQQTQANIQSLAGQLSELKESNQSQFEDNKNQVETITNQLKDLQQLTSNLSKATKKIQENGQNLTNKHKALVEVVNCLREIENRSHFIEHRDNLDQSYFERALSHESLGDYEVAIADYGEAIRFNPNNAQAYYNRGVLRSKVGVKQDALDDLRLATKLFFEQGDLKKYQEARKLAQQIHAIDAPGVDSAKDQVPVAGLFSS